MFVMDQQSGYLEVLVHSLFWFKLKVCFYFLIYKSIYRLFIFSFHSLTLNAPHDYFSNHNFILKVKNKTRVKDIFLYYGITVIALSPCGFRDLFMRMSGKEPYISTCYESRTSTLFWLSPTLNIFKKRLDRLT